MAEKSSSRSARKRDSSTDPFRKYEESFTATPDPWAEITKLEHGADRTFASTVRSMVVNAEPAQRPGMETKLLAALARPDCTPAGARFACQMLALIGSDKAVPALAARLANPDTADDARYALEPNPDPAVNPALRAALDKLTGAPKAGLIGTLALRGDSAALPALLAIQKNSSETAEVRAAASRAIERLNARS